MIMPRKKKTYHVIDPEEAIQALSSLKGEPNFLKYIEMRESMREWRQRYDASELGIKKNATPK